MHCSLQWPPAPKESKVTDLYKTLLANFFFCLLFWASQMTWASCFVTYETQHIHPGTCLPWLSLPGATICWAVVDVGMHCAPVPGCCNSQRNEVGKPRPSQHRETNRLPILHEHRRTSSSQWSSKSSMTAIASCFSCNVFNFSSIFSAFSQSFKKRRIFSSPSFTGSSFFGKVSK